MDKISVPFFFVFLVVFSQLCVTPSTAQSLSSSEKHDARKKFQIEVGPSYFFHLRDRDQENPNIPDEFERLEERPTVAAFYQDNFGIKSIFLYNFKVDEVTSTLQIGISHEYHFVNNRVRYREIRPIMGEKLHLHNFFPFIGFTSAYLSDNIGTFYKAGPSFRFYKGEAEWDGLDVKHQYKSSVGFRVTGGIAFLNLSKKVPVYMNLELGIDLGTIERDNVEFYESGNLVGEAEPTGITSMLDYLATVSWTLGYSF